MTDRQDKFPTTVEAAVRLLQGLVPDVEQEKIAAMKEDELMALHFGIGQWARNHMGLWGAMLGVKAIPSEWLEPLELRKVITDLANDLYSFKDWDIGEYSENEEMNQCVWQKYPGF